MSAPGLALARPAAWTRLGAFLRTDGAARLLAGIAILVLWEAVVRLWAPPYVARPTGIAVALPGVMTNPAFWQAAGVTLLGVAQGLMIAIVAGTIVGAAMGRIRVVANLLQLYVNGFFTMPMVAILPLVTLWFGYTGDARLATVVFAAFFVIAVNMADGARAVPPEYMEVSRSFRASGWTRLFDVILPSSVPYLLAGIRLAAGRALIGAIVAEFFAALPGLGYFILFNTRTFRHNEAFVGVLLLAAFGVGLELLVNWGTRRFLPWYRREDRAN